MGGVVAAGVAVVTAAALVLGGGGEKEVLTEADRPAEVTTPVAPAPAEDRADDDTRDIDRTRDEDTVAAAATSTPATGPAAEVVPLPPADEPAPATEDTSSPDTNEAATNDADTSEPGTDSGTAPGTDPGTAPGTDPGTAPDTTPSDDPTDEGSESPDSGTTPGTDPGGTTDPEPVVEFGFQAGAPTPTPVGHGESTVEVALRLVGVETGGTLTLTIEGGSGGSHTILSASGCTVAGDGQSATCDVATGEELLALDVAVRTPGKGKAATLVASFAGKNVSVPLK